MIKKTGLFFCIVAFMGCQKLNPDSVQIPEYPDFEVLMKEQVELLGNSQAKKEVWLDGQSEVQILDMDSAKWAGELSFLKEINPNQPEYVGAFEKSGDELFMTLNLAAREKAVLKKATIIKNDDGYEKIVASFHEDKDVYVHHREIELNFENGRLSSLQIDGYQKMMFKDTLRFRIKVFPN